MRLYFKSRKSRASASFIAWCSPEPLTLDCPVSDPAEPIYFEFGDTRHEAEQNLQKKFPAVTEWACQNQS